MTRTLKIIADLDDVRCLDAHRGDADASSTIYGVLAPVGAKIAKGAIYRRHCLFPHEAQLSDDGNARLVADLAGHEEARLLKLNPGEFFGLQINAWRNRSGLVFNNCHPMPHWMLLIGLAHYKIERARRTGHRDEAARLKSVGAMLRGRYEAARALHSRDITGQTLQ